MKKYLSILFIFISCGTTQPIPNPAPPVPIPVPKPTPEPIVRDTIHIIDTIRQVVPIQDSAYIFNLSGEVNVKDFGAKCDGVTDDIIADSLACAYCIANPIFCTTVIFPVGHSRISRPLLLSNNDHYFTIHLKGMLPAKEASDAYLSQINYDSKSGYAIGIQGGRGIILENLAIIGKYTFPYSVNNQNIATLRFNDWVDSTITDTRTNPYAGIVIDPLQGIGTSGVEIRQCSIKQFMVGICLSPQNTVNDEMVNIIDDDIEAVRVAIAIGQDQSKEIHIDRLKAWASVHTILDGLTYGRGTGGGSVDIEGGNFAGNINELFNLNTDRFSLSVKDVYSESIFRLGTVGKWSGANFINCQIDFLMGPSMPEPDFILSGIGNFYGGMFRYYDNDGGHRMNFTDMNSMFRDMTLNSAPITVGLIGYPNQVWPTAIFDHVNLYNMGYLLKPVYDTLIPIPRGYSLTVDSVKWTSVFYQAGISKIAQYNDYIIGGSSSGYGHYYDKVLNPNGCATIIIGRVNKISNDTLYMGNVGLNAPENLGFDALYLSRLK